jgi:hypothetical protein
MYHNKKRREDPMFKLKSYLRTRLWKFFNKINKSKNTQKLLQCSWQEARNHLESKFQAGMTWENYGEWHVDHIIPLHSAKTIFELENLCKYLNLQPLWKSDHYTKTQKDRVLYGDT